jgi:protein transport protein SEC24
MMSTGIPPSTAAGSMLHHQLSAGADAPQMPKVAFMNPNMGGAMGAVHPPGAPTMSVPDEFAAGGIPGAPAVAHGAPDAATSAMSAAAAAAAMATPMREIDEDALAPTQYMHATVAAFPATAELARRCAIPLGVSVHPLAESPDLPDMSVVDHTSLDGVVRCSECRAYIHPFCEFLDEGRRWQCSICGSIMPVQNGYFAPLDVSGKRSDIASRPELRLGSVEYVATKEYVVRAPQPPTYVFVIDASVQASASGMLQVAARAIKASLDGLPGGDRTQVAFLTFDSTVHFYRFRPGCERPSVMIMPEINDPFVPCNDDLVVNLQDHREAVDAMLDSLAEMHSEARSADSCFGTALMQAFTIMQHVGGKLCAFVSCLPSLGQGRLRQREAPTMLGSATEHKLLSPDDDEKAQGLFYRQQAMDFSRHQICVDTFLFSPRYTDVASIAAISRFTSGQTFYYPGFTSMADGARFHSDLVHDLTRTTGFEAVMRVRCSRGVRVLNFYGNFFIRGQDLLAMPNVTSDTAFNIELEHTSEPLSPGSLVTIQAALLFTNADGNRRITVHTLCIPVSARPEDVFENSDAEAISNMISKRALDVALRTGLPQSRQAIHNQVVGIVRAHHSIVGSKAAGPAATSAASAGPAMSLPEGLMLLPLYGLGLQKCSLFRAGTDVHSDERAALVYRALGMPVVCSTPMAYPRMYALHRLPPGTGEEFDDEAAAAAAGDDYEPPATAGFANILLPPAEGLSAMRLESHGAYLLEDSVDAFVWIGKDASPDLLKALLGVPSLSGIDTSNITLPTIDTPLNAKVRTLLEALADTSPQLPRLRVVLQGSRNPIEGRFYLRLVEDRHEMPGGALSYADYLGAVNREAATGGGATMPGVRHMQLPTPAPGTH